MDIQDLTLAFPPWGRPFFPVRDLNLKVARGSVLGLVGQSGSGKSMTALAVLGMVPRPGRIARGSIRFMGRELTTMPPRTYRRLRGREMFLIFQGSGSALTPSLTVGRQMAEVFESIHGHGRRQALVATGDALEKVRLAPEVAACYPFELSGGMRQRVLVAMALAMRPRLIIADEPTTGLDMVTQAEILKIFEAYRADGQGTMILITHDLRAVGHLADEVAVMHAGTIVDHCAVDQLPRSARHAQTRELLAACSAFSLPEANHAED